MNFNTSPLAFFPSRAAQSWRAWWHQNKQCIICGNDLIPFYIQNVDEDAPTTCELYNPNTDTKVADLNCYPHLLTHTATVDGQSVKVWIYQATQAGVFGYTQAGYYYLKIGSYYSDVFRIGALPSEYVSVSWQFYDDIMTVDGSLLSKYIVYKQIFPVPLWKPEYNIEEEGKTNNGVFFATQQTTKKTCSFESVCNEPQADVMNLVRMADSVQIDACSNGVQRSYNSNQFEVEIKWQTDDTATVKCDFDLFNIVRKYQKSATAPEPLPIPQPPTPPTVFNIKGTAATGVNQVTIVVDGTPVNVSTYGNTWAYGYDTALTYSFSTTDSNILTIDFSESCKLKNIKNFFINAVNVTSIDFTGCTLESLIHTNEMFYNCKSLTAVNIPNANINTTVSTGTVDNMSMFASCYNLKTINIPNSNLNKQLGNTYKYMFQECESLESVYIPDTDFSVGTSFEGMFSHAKTDATFTFGTAASLQNITNMNQMFLGAIGSLNLRSIFPSATLTPTTADKLCWAAKELTSIDLTGLDFSNITDMTEAFRGAKKMTSLVLDTNTIGGVEIWDGCFMSCEQYSGSAVANTFAGFSFANAISTENMFNGAITGALSLPDATFASVTSAYHMFASTKATSISLPSATFASVSEDEGGNLFRESATLTSVSMPSATFAAMTYTVKWGLECNAWTTYTGSTSATFTDNFIIYARNITAASVLEIIKMFAPSQSSQVFGIYTDTWNAYDAADQTAINAALTAVNRHLAYF